MKPTIEEHNAAVTSQPVRQSIWLPCAAALIGCVYFLLHSLLVIFGSSNRVMEWLYDDSFYYMITASHFSSHHISSFDGLTLTTGYHPLWMWLCAAIFGIRGQLDFTYVRTCMALALCITSIVLLIALRDAYTHKRRNLLWVLALAASSYSALNNGLTVMEWPLVLLCWYLLHRVMVARSSTGLKIVYFAAFFIGATGSLSRTDFGLVAVCYLVAATLVGLRYRSWDAARKAGFALAGAVAGLGVVLLYNHAMTGTWLQKSAEVKRLSASLLNPFNPVPAVWQFVRVLLYLPSLDLEPDWQAHLLRLVFRVMIVGLVLAMALAVAKYRWLAKKLAIAWSRGPEEDLVLTASVLAVLGYVLLYGFNSQATFGWYTGTVTGFIVILAARLLGALPRKLAAILVLPILFANMIVAARYGGNARSQQQEVIVGEKMHAQHPNARMGGGDVGKPSFFNGGTMINLDGLMNDEVIPYLASGNIHCYVLDRHIEYISDMGSLTVPITDAVRAKRGLAPLPWSRYFEAVPATANAKHDETDYSYSKTNFQAIRDSGDCRNEPMN